MSDDSDLQKFMRDHPDFQRDYRSLIIDFQKHYKPLIERIDSQPECRSEFERISFDPNTARAEWYRAKKNKETDRQAFRKACERVQREGVDFAVPDERERAEALYKQGLHTKIGSLEDAVKAYVAFGRVSWSKADGLGRELHFVTTVRERLQRHPFLGKFLNLCCYKADLTEAYMAYAAPEWLAVVAYANDKFPELNLKKDKTASA